jgi:RNA polymerase sigma-70 factor (ECF subfamily)
LKLAYERLLNAQRGHRAAARRSVDREVGLPDRSSLLLARPLLASRDPAGQRLEAQEFAERVGLAVRELDPDDRELLLMRHVEELPYKEIGCLLDIEPAAARKRYGRALLHLRRVLIVHRILESHL